MVESERVRTSHIARRSVFQPSGFGVPRKTASASFSPATGSVICTAPLAAAASTRAGLLSS